MNAVHASLYDRLFIFSLLFIRKKSHFLLIKLTEKITKPIILIFNTARFYYFISYLLLSKDIKIKEFDSSIKY